MVKLQVRYSGKYDCDFGSGYNQMHEYIKEHHKLVSSDIIKYEEELKKAKDNCQLEFRESFLARLKENIENAKLTAYDDKGEKVLAEYTDYRSYLDYDIIVEKKDGTVQRFSKIYGEKSGGETQTPYYVAIAASFVQLYKLGDTIRIIMLDEAFDKMDDNRISSMMDF